MSFTEEVIAITPAGQVLTFENERNAKMVLLNKYHNQIIVSPSDLAKRFTTEQLKDIPKRTLKLIEQDPDVEQTGYMTDRNRLAEHLWPLLVSRGRLTTKLAYGKNTIDPLLPTHVTYYTDYVPGKDPIRDTNYYRLPKQARVIVDMLVEKLLPAKEHGVPSFVMDKWIEEAPIETRQGKRYIFKYYLKTLMVKGFIEIYKPEQARRK